MSVYNHRSRMWRVALGVMMLTFLAHAQSKDSTKVEIPKVPNVPDTLPAIQLNAFNEQRDELKAEKAKYIAVNETHNKTSRNVPANTPVSERRRLERDQLRDWGVELSNKIQAFSNAVAQAEARQESERVARLRANPEELRRKFIEDLGTRSRPGIQPPTIAPLIINFETNRNAFEYAKAIDQFEVEKSNRYQIWITNLNGKVSTTTWCNVFAQDVSRAMNVEIPANKSADEMREWLDGKGRKRGWNSTSDPDVAQGMAGKGHPTFVFVSKHVAAVRPGSTNEVDEARRPQYVAITQAGGSNIDHKHLRDGFKIKDIPKAQYWYHE